MEPALVEGPIRRVWTNKFKEQCSVSASLSFCPLKCLSFCHPQGVLQAFFNTQLLVLAVLWGGKDGACVQVRETQLGESSSSTGEEPVPRWHQVALELWRSTRDGKYTWGEKLQMSGSRWLSSTNKEKGESNKTYNENQLLIFQRRQLEVTEMCVWKKCDLICSLGLMKSWDTCLHNQA